MPTRLLAIARSLSADVASLAFSPPVAHVYNPLQYAWRGHEAYLKQFGEGPKRTLFLGMNPGPWGMAQTGVPFGEVGYVRDWMGIDVPIDKPESEHPKRPIDGLNCSRSEVSGRRLWGLFAERFDSPLRFFHNHLVVNFCPLLFIAASGRNIPPDKLPAAESELLLLRCRAHLQDILDVCRPEWVVAVGAFAESQVRRVHSTDVKILRILHPSPANPAANRDWAGAATRTLIDNGVWD